MGLDKVILLIFRPNIKQCIFIHLEFIVNIEDKDYVKKLLKNLMKKLILMNRILRIEEIKET